MLGFEFAADQGAELNARVEQREASVQQRRYGIVQGFGKAVGHAVATGGEATQGALRCEPSSEGSLVGPGDRDEAFGGFDFASGVMRGVVLADDGGVEPFARNAVRVEVPADRGRGR